MRRPALLCLVFFAALGCKKPAENLSETKDVESAYRGVFQLGPEMFVPYSNVGLDRAFCAGTTAMHATVINRARFFDANPPSQKCPAKWNVQDDAKYEQAAWDAIQQETMKEDFTSMNTINIFGAASFSEFGTRGLTYFADKVRSMHNRFGQIAKWGTVNPEKLEFNDFNDIGNKVRQGNMVIVFVYKTGKDPDEIYTNTYATLKEDCEARGYTWDPIANECDWKRQMDPNHPFAPQPTPPPQNDNTNNFNSAESNQNSDTIDSAIGINVTDNQQQNPMQPTTQQPTRPTNPNAAYQNNSQIKPGDPQYNTIHPSQDRELFVNHAVLVTGVYDDGSLQVYTTWDQQLVRWSKNLQVSGGMYGWMINPIIMKSIPIKKGQDRSQAPDVLKRLNDYYAYTGSQAAAGCPGTGGNPVTSRVENGSYTPPNYSNFNPYDPKPAVNTQGNWNNITGPQDVPFAFIANFHMQNGRPHVRISNIVGCFEGGISWVVSATGYTAPDEKLNINESSLRTIRRFKTSAKSLGFSTALDSSTNRWHVTGTCKNKRPFSAIVADPGFQTQNQ